MSTTTKNLGPVSAYGLAKEGGYTGTKAAFEAALKRMASESYALLQHTHSKSDVTDFAHNHAQSEITGLAAALAAKLGVVSSLPTATAATVGNLAILSGTGHIYIGVSGTATRRVVSSGHRSFTLSTDSSSAAGLDFPKGKTFTWSGTYTARDGNIYDYYTTTDDSNLTWYLSLYYDGSKLVALMRSGVAPASWGSLNTSNYYHTQTAVSALTLYYLNNRTWTTDGDGNVNFSWTGTLPGNYREIVLSGFSDAAMNGTYVPAGTTVSVTGYGPYSGTREYDVYTNGTYHLYGVFKQMNYTFNYAIGTYDGSSYSTLLYAPTDDLDSLSGNWGDLYGMNTTTITASLTCYDDEEYTTYGWTDVNGEPDYLCFTAEAAGSSLRLDRIGDVSMIANSKLEYSSDGLSWKDYAWDAGDNATGETITLAAVGDHVYFRGNNNYLGRNTNTHHRFVMTGRIAASGNVMSLLSKTLSKAVPNYYGTFHSLFRDCTSLTTAPELPATTLIAAYCYQEMFYGCTSLTTAPELPATTLSRYCYKEMFYGCTSLTTAPKLPATTLTDHCYDSLFRGCTSLTTPPELPSLSILSASYDSLFRDCTSLTTAPELPAFQAATNACYHMFRGCSSLAYLKVGFTTWPTGTANWMMDVGSTGRFVCPATLDTTTRGTAKVPYGWTVERDTVLDSSLNSSSGTGDASCLLAGTAIALADGTSKPIEEVGYRDTLLVWDFDEGKPAAAKPAWIVKSGTVRHYEEAVFSDGTVIRHTGKRGMGHRAFSLSQGKFVYLGEMEIGDLVPTKDGQTVALVSNTLVEEDCGFYNVITAEHYNCYANGLLTSCSLNNLYPIADMKFVKEEREAVAVPESVPEEMAKALRLSEQLEEKGEYALRLVAKKAAPARYSKYKLLCALDDAGLWDTVWNAMGRYQQFWNAAAELVETDRLFLAALSAIEGAINLGEITLPEGVTVDAILKAAEIREDANA